MQQNGKSLEEPVDAAEAAKYLKKHPKTVMGLAREGKIPAHRVPGSTRWLFFISELHAMLTSGVASTQCSCRS